MGQIKIEGTSEMFNATMSVASLLSYCKHMSELEPEDAIRFHKNNNFSAINDIEVISNFIKGKYN